MSVRDWHDQLTDEEVRSDAEYLTHMEAEYGAEYADLATEAREALRERESSGDGDAGAVE